MTTKAIPIYQTELEKAFRYNPLTNILERKWKRDENWRIVDVKPDKLGYSRGSVNGRTILMHRLIWTLVNGDITKGLQVDHIDGNPENNKLSNLQLLSPQDNVNKSRADINPRFDTKRGQYRVKVGVRINGKKRTFNFKSFKILAEAQDFCDAYNALFGWGKPFYSVRTKTYEYWRSCMQAFKDQYFNTIG